MEAIFILYVKDQQKSRDFYATVLQKEPVLDVPGMTEFQVNVYTKIGLMPEEGIEKILDGKTPSPSSGNGVPRCEIYLYVAEPEVFLERAIYAGATEISPYKLRDWEDHAGYVADPDGHVLVFAMQEA
ncbi:MAG: VOC family protein [Bacteroidia bacterium]